MSTKPLIYVGLVVGSALGGAVPLLWGGGIFSFSSIIFSALGAILGIFVAFKIVNY